MGVFTIYAIVVTGLFLLYMTVTIALDLYGKKAQKKDETEIFNTSEDGDEEEAAHIVNETDGGYSIGQDDVEVPDFESQEDDNGGYQDDGDDGDIEQEEQEVDDNPDDDTLLQEESMSSQAQYESLKEVQNRMEAAVPVYQHQYGSDDFAFMMAQPMNKETRILRTILKV